MKLGEGLMTNFNHNRWFCASERRVSRGEALGRRRLHPSLPRLLQRQVKHELPVDGDPHQYSRGVTIDRVVCVVDVCEKRSLFLMTRSPGPSLPVPVGGRERTIDFSSSSGIIRTHLESPCPKGRPRDSTRTGVGDPTT